MQKKSSVISSLSSQKDESRIEEEKSEQIIASHQQPIHGEEHKA